MATLARVKPDQAREIFQINNNLPQKMTIKATGAVILFNQETLTFAFFNKRAGKPSQWRRAKSLDSFEVHINALVEREIKDAPVKDKTPHSLNVGDILNTSWGYDQTNVNFYQIIEKNGATMITVRELLQESSQEKDMTSHVVPRPNEFLNEKTFRCKVSAGNYVKVENYSAKLVPFTTIESTGTKIYKPQYRSYYH